MKVNRGRRSIVEIFSIAQSIGARLLILVSVRKGNPAVIDVYGIPSNQRMYSFSIKAMRLMSDYKVPYYGVTRRRLCIESSTARCYQVNSFLVDAGARHKNICDTFAEVSETSFCEIKFKNKKGDELLMLGLES
ncbi:hypothetical protein [Metallosphaera tengchongensis]|uniref:hypothetical protein n=1 Tax=Metallosphaera tengchongensis TaxID=1532350 RepID=UPI001C2E5FC8|nr:hypothetical protein [Metallosphaera tengchongensis]